MKKLLDKYKGRINLLEELKADQGLTNSERNFIWFYYNPRPLLDMELPGRIMEQRGATGAAGYLAPHLPEMMLLMEAEKSKQYGRYMRHLLYSYDLPEKVYQLAGDQECECGLCKKTIYQLGLWDSKVPQGHSERQEQKYIAYGSEDTAITLCMPCLIQLKYFEEFLDETRPDRYRPMKRE